MIEQNKIGKRIRILRTLKKVSQDEISKYLGISFQQFQKYEKGTSKITIDRLQKIAEFFNIKTEMFFNNEEWEKIENFGK